MGFLGFLAAPIGWLMRMIYTLVNNYFVTILLVTLLVRLITFPLNIKSQKSAMERARLAPRLERLQKKYGQDRQKLAQKQQELYQKEGVSLMGGCLPQLIQLIVLFSMISVIYYPLKYLTQIPDQAINYAVYAVNVDNYGKDKPLHEEGKDLSHKLPANKLTGYYAELNMMKSLEENREDILAYLQKEEEGKTAYTAEQANAYYEEILTIRNQFNIFGMTMLEVPWGEKGFAGISWLWLIPLLSGLSAFLSSVISMRYMKGTMGPEQPGQGCSNNMMMIFMPLFSLIITFTVPGGVGIYWICSNLIGVAQTVVLNKMYNPTKARAQAQAEYEERRRRKAEDKKRLAQAHAQEAEQARREEEEALEAQRQRQEAAQKKAPAPSKNPNKRKKKADAQGETTTEVSEESPADNQVPPSQTPEAPDADQTAGGSAEAGKAPCADETEAAAPDGEKTQNDGRPTE